MPLRSIVSPHWILLYWQRHYVASGMGGCRRDLLARREPPGVSRSSVRRMPDALRAISSRAAWCAANPARGYVGEMPLRGRGERQVSEICFYTFFTFTLFFTFGNSLKLLLICIGIIAQSRLLCKIWHGQRASARRYGPSWRWRRRWMRSVGMARVPLRVRRHGQSASARP